MTRIFGNHQHANNKPQEETPNQDIQVPNSPVDQITRPRQMTTVQNTKSQVHQKTHAEMPTKDQIRDSDAPSSDNQINKEMHSSYRNNMAQSIKESNKGT